LSKHVRTRVSAKPTSLTAPAAAREAASGLPSSHGVLFYESNFSLRCSTTPSSPSSPPPQPAVQLHDQRSGAAVRLADSPTNSHTTNAAGTLVGPATLNSEHLLNTRRFRIDGGYRRAITLPAHLRDWLMHQPKRLDCDSDGLLTDRGPKPSGNSVCCLTAPASTGPSCLALPGTQPLGWNPVRYMNPCPCM